MTGAGPAVTGDPVRFFQIGFQKCGTSAIAAFLNRSGIPCIHYDRGRLARRMRENLAQGRRPLEGYERYRAFANMDWAGMDRAGGGDFFDGFACHRALDAAYGGRFILNTRPVEHWLASLMAHNARRGVAQDAAHCLRRFGTTDPGAVAAGWRALWEAHHHRVRAEIDPARLLVFDIESDPPERLCDFAGLDRACARHWRLENPSPSPVAAAFLELLPRPVKRAVPDRIKLPVKRLLRTRR